MSRTAGSLSLGLCLWLALAGAAVSQVVGERRLTAHEPTAVLRDAEHRDAVRVTVWYPAARGVPERSLDIGPAGAPLFRVGEAAPDAPFADDRRRPVILLSHGFGGSARIMGWFGLALARHGYVVIAVDHPGNNGLDRMTAAGVVLNWDRARDLAAALAVVKADSAIGPHLDLARLGVAGFSAGGFTALVAAGARVDPPRLEAFCAAHPADGICRPQKEFALSQAEAKAALASAELASEAVRAGEDHAIPGLRAVFVMAPAIVQELDPASLGRIRVPVAIVVGTVDPVAAADTNALVAARLIPGAKVAVLAGVGHYDFLGTCTPAGVRNVPVCTAKVSQDETHASAIAQAERLFDGALGAP